MASAAEPVTEATFNASSIEEQLNFLEQCIFEASTSFRWFHRNHEEYNTYKACLENTESSVQDDHQLQQLQSKVAPLKDYMRQKIQYLVGVHHSLILKLEKIVQQLGLVQNRILGDKLDDWKESQQRARNGVPIRPTSNLDEIQKWIDYLLELILHTFQSVQLFESLQLPEFGNNAEGREGTLSKLLKNLLSELASKVLVIENQPPQILMENRKFSANLRLLTTRNFCLPELVKVVIVNESQAAAIQHDANQILGCGDIKNGIARAEKDSETSTTKINFSNMVLKQKGRSHRRRTENLVTDMKYGLLFKTTLVLNGINFQVSVLSLPVVVVVHGSQEPQSWATIFWDDSFAKRGRKPFEVPQEASWQAFAENLRYRFAKESERDLSDDNLRFLYELIHRKQIRPDLSDYQAPVTWQSFAKDKLLDGEFSFRIWFFEVMKLVHKSEDVKDAWVKGHVLGFIHKEQATELLLATKQPGSFLLRFSLSEPGALSFAWLTENSTVEMCAPISKEKIKIVGLADILASQKYLQHLQPGNILKEDAFEPRNEEKAKEPYRNIKLNITVDCGHEPSTGLDMAPAERANQDQVPLPPFQEIKQPQPMQTRPKDGFPMDEMLGPESLPFWFPGDENMSFPSGSEEHNGNGEDIEDILGITLV